MNDIKHNLASIRNPRILFESLELNEKPSVLWEMNLEDIPNYSLFPHFLKMKDCAKLGCKIIILIDSEDDDIVKYYCNICNTFIITLRMTTYSIKIVTKRPHHIKAQIIPNHVYNIDENYTYLILSCVNILDDVQLTWNNIQIRNCLQKRNMTLPLILHSILFPIYHKIIINDISYHDKKSIEIAINIGQITEQMLHEEIIKMFIELIYPIQIQMTSRASLRLKRTINCKELHHGAFHLID